MKERIYQHLWLPDRGVTVMLPPHATSNLADAQNNNQTLSPVESERLRIIGRNSTLRKRYPTAEDGANVMTGVDYEKRHRLLKYANDLSQAILLEWQVIKPNEPLAILLFGSVARGLVLPDTHPAVSNIDLEVLGSITDDDKTRLLNAIRPYRETCQRLTIAERPDISTNTRQGYPFVQVQDISRVKNGAYAEALELVGSCAFPLHDPTNIWAPIEEEALAFSYQTNSRKRNSHRYRSMGVVFNNNK